MPHKTVSRTFPCSPALLSMCCLCAIASLPALAASPSANAKGGPMAAQGPKACGDISDDSARLACYDRRFGRSATPEPEDPIPGTAAAAAASAPGPSDAADSAPRTPTPLSAFWELGPADKRGTFRVLTYRPNILLPLIMSNHINREPRSPTHGAPLTLPNYKHLEAMVQVSLRTKLAQDLLLPDADLWFGYTHRAQWQVWTGEESRPFRNTDYEPELIYVVPVPKAWRGLPGNWRWRMLTLGVAHQSNGQTDPLSRSWNRVDVGTAFEHGDFSLELSTSKRMNERHRDDNPDLTDYLGRSELRASWLPGKSITTATWRTNLQGWDKGSVQLEWSYPVSSEQPQGLRWYVRAFNGYGDSLLDYNFRKASLGVGLTIFNF